MFFRKSSQVERIYDNEQKLSRLKSCAEFVRVRQYHQYSVEVDMILQLITASIGKHFKAKKTTDAQRSYLLRMAISILSMAADWIDPVESYIKAQRLWNLEKKVREEYY